MNTELSPCVEMLCSYVSATIIATATHVSYFACQVDYEGVPNVQMRYCKHEKSVQCVEQTKSMNVPGRIDPKRSCQTAMVELCRITGSSTIMALTFNIVDKSRQVDIILPNSKRALARSDYVFDRPKVLASGIAILVMKKIMPTALFCCPRLEVTMPFAPD